MSDNQDIVDELENINSAICDISNMLPSDFNTNIRPIEKKLDSIIELMERQVDLSERILDTLADR
ncbi:hypothetical protein GYB57_05875 [bacterium]|nr:hypothetical protein [bacterium]